MALSTSVSSVAQLPRERGRGIRSVKSSTRPPAGHHRRTAAPSRPSWPGTPYPTAAADHAVAVSAVSSRGLITAASWPSPAHRDASAGIHPTAASPCPANTGSKPAFTAGLIATCLVGTTVVTFRVPRVRGASRGGFFRFPVPPRWPQGYRGQHQRGDHRGQRQLNRDERVGAVRHHHPHSNGPGRHRSAADPAAARAAMSLARPGQRAEPPVRGAGEETWGVGHVGDPHLVDRRRLQPIAAASTASGRLRPPRPGGPPVTLPACCERRPSSTARLNSAQLFTCTGATLVPPGWPPPACRAS